MKHTKKPIVVSREDDWSPCGIKLLKVLGVCLHPQTIEKKSLQNYNDHFYYHFGDYEQDSESHSQQGQQLKEVAVSMKEL